MYKPISKTRFMGKNIIYLTSCHSTNDIAAHKVRSGLAENGDVVIADEQTAGRGLQGNSWKSSKGLNFMLSVILKPQDLKVSEQFCLSQCIALGVQRYVASVAGEGVKIKWPNDILIGTRKAVGILIESTVRGNSVLSSVAGIGLNVNEKDFGHPRITSLANETGRFFSLEEELGKLLLCLEEYYAYLDAGKRGELNEMYLEALFGLGEERDFIAGDEAFRGIVSGVTTEGRLKVLAGAEEKNYDIKEIAWVW